ncbi:DNA-binding domain-containing protein [Saccharicrinis aurantiacus]|uniref:DNA-binding domain-containing protein n=1 Tax=Saccharicrinis aurantiacus TaxID=1849719 RepID=UPI00249190F5|nr:DNA-binding domain-containing protein [Saccharicrinis aurantiacus]
MPLRYGVIANHLTADPDDLMGVVTDNDTITTEKIVEMMAGKGSTVTKAEALSVIEEYEYAIVNAIKQGNNVNTELFKIYPSISGVFINDEDTFTASRHAVKLNLNAGPRLASAVSDIELRKVEVKGSMPVIQKITNVKTGAVNEDFTSGQLLSIMGSHIKFDEEDAEQGVFFIAADKSETRASNVFKNKPSELLVFAPEGLSGVFTIEVRLKARRSSTLRVGRSNFDMTATN